MNKCIKIILTIFTVIIFIIIFIVYIIVLLFNFLFEKLEYYTRKVASKLCDTRDWLGNKLIKN